MPSAPSQTGEISSAAADGNRQFHAELADGLHALAQPLTILRSAIEMMGVCRQSGKDDQRYVELSMEHIQRACDMFDSIQGLMLTRLVPAKNGPVDFGAVASRVVEEKNIVLKARGIGIASAIAPDLRPAAGDAERAEEAIAAAIDAAALMAAEGDVIQLLVAETGGFIELSVRGANKAGAAMPAAARLCLSLARAHILSQQGRYYFVDEPFSISLALPISTVLSSAARQ